MFKSERMKHVMIAGSSGALHDTVEFLYKSGNFHIMDYKVKDDVYDIGHPLPEADAVSHKLLKLMSIAQSMELEDSDAAVEHAIPVSTIKRDVDAAISHLELEISSEVHARKEITPLLAEKKNELASVRQFDHIPFSLDLLRDYESLKVYCGRLKSDPVEDLRKLGVPFDIIRGGVSIVLVDAREDEAARSVLSKHGFSDVQLPPIHNTPAVAIKRLKGEIAGLEKRLESIDKRLHKLRNDQGLFVSAAIEDLSIRANMAEAPLRFGVADYSFVIDAWTPVKSYEKMKERLSHIHNGAVEIVELDWDGKEDEPPTRLDNPRSVRPMEMLLEMFSLPKYNEIDPTGIMLFTFPLLYGMILGDVGYGLVIVALVLSGALSKLMSRLGMSGGSYGLNRLLLLSGISTIIFGFLYDEFFGFEPFSDIINFEIFGIHFPVHRASEYMVTTMLVFCIYVGVAHLFLGFLVGFINELKNHGLSVAVREKVGWMLLLFGLVLVAFNTIPLMVSGGEIDFTGLPLVLGMGLLVAGAIMTFSVEGINSVLEMPGLASNLLSYTRIYAIGMSSIGIALAFNEEMALPAMEGGGIGLVIGAFVLVAGHSLNLVLGIIGPLIQTLRLHYVEFFTKFYRGGGEKFKPLSYRRKYTKEV